ncbi:MAG: N-acetylglucosamine-6-phosphate deacetylase [Chitinophagia bacterium]|nr:N-acetylglucosamine-6-phosphate deacetylase [Chitinophagia bacterium]
MSNLSNNRYYIHRLFTGTEWRHSVMLEIMDGRVEAITPANPADANNWIPLMAPAFIDLQLYGAEGRLLSVFPDAETIHAIRRTCEKGGATHFQPTVATNSREVFLRCIDAVRAYWHQGGEGCIGLHVEGPWIHPAKKGAHLEQYIEKGTLETVASLLEAGKDVISMVTLAPECCDESVVALLMRAGVMVSAGHSNATYEQATRAFNRGIPVATHLFNAMSALQHRSPGMVGAILDHDFVKASVIPDGHHVDYAAIRVAKKIMGDRLFIITDAVTDTNAGPYQHQRVGNKFESAGVLSGSMITMAEGVNNLIEQVGIEEDEAMRMASLYPARVMGRADIKGRIEVGEKFFAVMFDNDRTVLGVLRN